MKKGRRVSISLLGATCLLGVLASLADANLIAHGDLFVSFNGGISPSALPRDSLAPVSISLEGIVRTPPGVKPPPLQQIKIALNRGGVLDTTGLPLCRRSQLEGTSSAGALRACRDALVGDGTYSAKASFPEQASFPAQGHILAFNGTSEGQPVIFAHVYGRSPAPSTGVITFYISRPRQAAFGTVLNANLPISLQGYGYLKRIVLHLHRLFSYRGARRSYLSAACAAPPGIQVVSFAFARASMRFEGGAVLNSTLIRSCKVASRHPRHRRRHRQALHRHRLLQDRRRPILDDLDQRLRGARRKGNQPGRPLQLRLPARALGRIGHEAMALASPALDPGQHRQVRRLDQLDQLRKLTRSPPRVIEAHPAEARLVLGEANCATPAITAHHLATIDSLAPFFHQALVRGFGARAATDARLGPARWTRLRA